MGSDGTDFASKFANIFKKKHITRPHDRREKITETEIVEPISVVMTYYLIPLLQLW